MIVNDYALLLKVFGEIGFQQLKVNNEANNYMDGIFSIWIMVINITERLRIKNLRCH